MINDINFNFTSFGLNDLTLNNVDIFKDSFGLNENIGAAIASSYSDNSVIVARFSHSFGKIPESSLNY